MPPPEFAGDAAGAKREVGSDGQRFQTWVDAGPTVLARNISFRASMRGGLAALPVTSTDQQGGFHIKLVRLSPSTLHRRPFKAGVEQRSEALQDGSDLLEAQLPLGLAAATAAPARMPGAVAIPQALLPDRKQAEELLRRYVRTSSDSRAKECLELVAAVHLDPAQAPNCSVGTSAPSKDVDKTSSRVSSWLTKVNVKTVNQFLSAPSSPPINAAPKLLEVVGKRGDDAQGVNAQLNRVFHLLTANSIRGALRELSKCMDVDTRKRLSFDRLAMLLAACAGTSSDDLERRQWMRLQVARWRAEGVHELMGSALWRIYCLLGGDIHPVLGDAVDWRAAFGMHLWYQCEAEDAGMGVTTKEPSQTRVTKAIAEFDRSVQKNGPDCRFRPVPQYAMKEYLRAKCKEEKEPLDMAYNILRTAAGLLGCEDLAHFDYAGQTSRPLDVCLSWHLSLVLLALKGVAAPPLFDLLTQQYCLQLELRGKWEWASYVACFVSDERARSLAVRGLLQRNCPRPCNLDVPVPAQIQLIPEVLVWRAQALRCEAAQDWVGAVSYWHKAGSKWRALTLLLSFLQAPLVLCHSRAPLQASQSDMVVLSPMSVPAKWLLSILEDVEGAASTAESTGWADLARTAVSFMRRWAKADGHAQCTRLELVQLHSQCLKLRKHLLGVPW
mmetsp:Transcript_64456/g.119910  ORF Transcript_64456/g.119910 Transcript_64456/m.119910 type:complete len:668 (-) Transcript_64456:77-2080(-)